MFYFSEESPKGSDCYDSFKTMQECFAQYPAVYNKNGGDGDDEDLDSVLGQESGSSNATMDGGNVDSVDELDETTEAPTEKESKAVASK